MYVYIKPKLTNTCTTYGIVRLTNSSETLMLYIILGDISINVVGYSLMSGESSHYSHSEELLVDVRSLFHVLSISTFLFQTVISPLTSYLFANSRSSPLLPTTLSRSCFHFEVDFA
jgi:hypothetical protein